MSSFSQGTDYITQKIWEQLSHLDHYHKAHSLQKIFAEVGCNPRSCPSRINYVKQRKIHNSCLKFVLLWFLRCSECRPCQKCSESGLCEICLLTIPNTCLNFNRKNEALLTASPHSVLKGDHCSAWSHKHCPRDWETTVHLSIEDYTCKSQNDLGNKSI